MLLGIDRNVIVHIGKAFTAYWDFIDVDGGITDLSTLGTCSVVLRNVEFPDDNSETVGSAAANTVTVNTALGRVTVNLTAADTAKFKLPDTEYHTFTHTTNYGKLIVLNQSNVPVLDISVIPLKV